MFGKTKKIILGVFLAVLGGTAMSVGSFLAYALMFSWIFTSADIPHKSDEELISNFRAHRDEFNQLVQMIMSDKGLHRVDGDWTDPKDPATIGISQKRIDEYRHLFRKLGIPRGFSANQDLGTVKLISSAQGLAISGSSKSYLYTKDTPPNLVDNIDRYRQEGNGSYPVYRRIEGDWYLMFDAD